MKGKRKTPEEFKKEAQEVLGDRYLILSEYKGSNSYIEVYHRDCDTISRIRANHLLAGSRCKCEKANPFSKKEVQEKIRQTMLERYGVEHPLQSKEIKDKMRKTMLERYGVENIYQSRKVKNSLISKYGTDNIGVIRNLPEIKEKIKLKLNTDNVFRLDYVKSKSRQTKLNRYGNENFNNRTKAIKTMNCKYFGVGFNSSIIREKIEQTNLEKYNTKHPTQSNEVRAKCVKTAKNTKSNVDDSKFDSSYERDVYDYCKRNNIEIEDRQVPIKFEYNGKEHTTFIDFKIDGYLIECKGSHLLDGVFDYKQEVPIEKKLEIYKQNHVIIVSNNSNLFPKAESKDSNGLRYLNKCPYPLIGIDIDLFRNPEFPYKKDRPECFYKVRVDNKPSALDAWSNETLRWKMIKNRIEYVGGFIDNKSILTAMNVTRTCKQPSWFSKKFAKDLIKKYITSDIILDPFAGWGTRCDAAKELKKKYYGWDLNEELVEWHHKQNRLFSNGCGIEYGDANNIKTVRSDCSVFICPPYTDSETYFDGQDLKTTQIEWLKLVMQNIPNAKEYLMVCKIIDKPEYNKYIVETKINKSHLGTNNEYVLYVNQSNRAEFLSI